MKAIQMKDMEEKGLFVQQNDSLRDHMQRSGNTGHGGQVRSTFFPSGVVPEQATMHRGVAFFPSFNLSSKRHFSIKGQELLCSIKLKKSRLK